MSIDHDDYEALPSKLSPVIHMGAGAAAGVMEHTLMYPLDSVKTRMQNIQTVEYKSISDAFGRIIYKEGSRRLFRGMSAMIVGAGPAHALYFSCYEKLKHVFTRGINGHANHTKWENSTIANGLAGACATFFHDIIMNPAEVVKQRMQVSGSLHSSCMRCVLHTYQTEGLGAFYRSFSTQLFMNIPFQATHFMVYEFTQERINPDRCYNPGTHIVSGAAAGGVASIVTNPLDVCKTLLNTQKHREDHAIRGLRQAVRTVYETNGIRTFFRGTTARVLYQMPSTAVSWSVYEFFKYLFNNNRARLTADIDIGTRMIVAVPPIVLDEP